MVVFINQSVPTSWLPTIGDVASIVGLLLSCWLLLISKKVARVAQETKQGLEKRSLALDLKAYRESVETMLMFAESNNWEAALYFSRHLSKDLNFIINRWTIHLSKYSTDVNEIIIQLDALNDQMKIYTGKRPTAKEVTVLTKAIDRIRNLISSLTGKYESTLDQP